MMMTKSLRVGGHGIDKELSCFLSKGRGIHWGAGGAVSTDPTRGGGTGRPWEGRIIGCPGADPLPEGRRQLLEQVHEESTSLVLVPASAQDVGAEVHL